MNWTETQRGTQRVWSTSLGGIPLDAARTSFVEVWRKFCDQVTVLSDKDDWDVIRIEFFSDNGKIVLYPFKWRAQKDVPVIAVEVISDWFKDFVRDRLFSDNASEEGEREIEALEKNLALQIGTAAEMFGMAKALGRKEVNVLFCMPGDDEFFHEATVHG